MKMMAKLVMMEMRLCSINRGMKIDRKMLKSKNKEEMLCPNMQPESQRVETKDKVRR